MRPLRPAAVLAALALVLAACAETGWRKAGSDSDKLKSDLGGCQALAHERIARPAPSAPAVTLSPRFGTIDGPVSPTDRRISEQQLVDSCMREKGYSLEPVTR